MKRTHSFLLTASIVLATTFTLSCSGDDGDKDEGGGGSCSADFGEVPIGTQIWAKKNLNCNLKGSKCYDNDEANCTKYGRLYDWATAKNACPSGWHLSTDDEWKVLVDYAGLSEANKLKATSGWNNSKDNGSNGNGTDEFGFSALPGGCGREDGSFRDVGDVGYWWSAAENRTSGAYDREILSGGYYENGNHFDGTGVDRGTGADNPRRLYSVRCVKD